MKRHLVVDGDLLLGAAGGTRWIVLQPRLARGRPFVGAFGSAVTGVKGHMGDEKGLRQSEAVVFGDLGDLGVGQGLVDDKKRGQGIVEI